MIETLDFKYDKEAYLLAKKLEGEKREAYILAYSEEKKSMTMALVMWFLLGGLGGHRFYLGNTGGGIRLLLSYLLIILPFILIIIDICNLGKNVKKYNSDIAHKCFNLHQ